MQFRELAQNVCHLVAALAAADVDDDIRIRPLCQLMLHDGFARTKRAGNSRHTAGGNREKRVDNALPRDHWRFRCELFRIGTPTAYRPLLQHGQFMLHALFVAYNRHHVRQPRDLAFALDDLAGNAVRDHDAMLDDGALLHLPDNRAACHLVAGLHKRLKAPFLFAVQARHFHAARNVHPVLLGNDSQRTLNAVENGFNQPWSKFHGKRRAGGFHRFAGAKTRRFLINLNGGLVAAKFNHLAHEAVFADANDIVHAHVRHIFRDNQRAGDLYNSSLLRHWVKSPLSHC